MLALKFEQAVRLLAEHFPVSEETSRKPILFHDLRVGVYLYERGYTEEIVLAGLLHDALEWSTVTDEMLRQEFGDKVVELVRASTKDDSIQDKDEKINELIRRCIDHGQDALIIKAADIIDSFKWYTKTNNLAELEYCRKNAEAILKFKPDSFDDKIFTELKSH